MRELQDGNEEENAQDESEESERAKAVRLKEIDGTVIAKQLELPGLRTRSSRNAETASGKPKPFSEKTSQKKKETQTYEQISEELDIKALKKELKQKNGIILKCQRQLQNLLNVVSVLKKNVEDAKKHISNMSYGTAFAKNKRFIKNFAKIMEKMVAKKVAQQNSIEGGSHGEYIETGGTITPEFFNSENGNNIFEKLIAYVEKKEREDNKMLSSGLFLHNINRNWDQSCAMIINEEGQPTATTGTDEKIPPGLETTARKPKPGLEQEKIKRKIKKPTASSKGHGTTRTASNRRSTTRIVTKSKSKDARLGKRSPSGFRQLQNEINEITQRKGKKLKFDLPLAVPEDRFLTNLTADTPADLVFQPSEKKSANKKKAPLQKQQSKTHVSEETDKKSKRESTSEHKKRSSN